MAITNRKATGILSAAIAVAALISALITFGPELGFDFIPGWGRIYQDAGLYGKVTDGVAVHFIDVGQGDCILIQAGDDFALIDGGPRVSQDAMLDYIRSQGVRKLTYVFATHLHEDHIGGLAKVVEEFEIESIVFQKSAVSSTKSTQAYENLLLAVSAKNKKIQTPKVNDIYELGGIRLQILAPLDEYENDNDRSLVIKAVCGRISFLLMGDAEKKSEAALTGSRADLSATVLKLGHHGSNTSSSESFLKRVSPLFAVVTCAKDNAFGHPHKEVVGRLSGMDIQLFRTDVNGSVVFITDGERIDYAVSSG